MPAFLPDLLLVGVSAGPGGLFRLAGPRIRTRPMATAAALILFLIPWAAPEGMPPFHRAIPGT